MDAATRVAGFSTAQTAGSRRSSPWARHQCCGANAHRGTTDISAYSALKVDCDSTLFGCTIWL
jgi:hypothetical protein